MVVRFLPRAVALPIRSARTPERDGSAGVSCPSRSPPLSAPRACGHLSGPAAARRSRCPDAAAGAGAAAGGRCGCGWAGTIEIVTDPSAALARAEEIAETVFYPAALDVDRSDTIPKSHLDRLAEEGFYGLAGPPEYGGLIDPALAPFS